MKKLILRTSIITAAVALIATSAMAIEYTKGVVKKVDLNSGKVTVKHEELKNLDMPGMTMVFRTKDEEMLRKLKPGTNILFVAERVKGKLTLTEVR